MANLKGKRLLILGGGLWCDAIKKYADEQEITLIATGNSKASNIFKIADEAHLINSTDAEKMKALIRENNIDGVYMGGSEPVISVACEYLNELGLPCYCTKAQWEYLQNKKNFKNLCIENGLPVVPKFDVSDTNPTLPEQAYPVITKPADGCGSSGFSVCHNNEELKCGYEKAKEDSVTGTVIVEKFVKNKGVVVFYTFSNGKAYFSGLEDKYPVKYEKEGSYVAGLLVFKSKFTEEFKQKFDDKISKMFSSIGIKKGSAWIEVFHDGEEYYFNEVGFRYGGTVSVYPIDYYYGINQVSADIHYALTGKSKIFGNTSLIPSDVPRKKHYAVYPIHLNAGTISHVFGMEELLSIKEIVAIPVSKNIGSEIKQTGSFSQTYALVHFVFDTTDELKAMISKIHQTLSIIDENGKNMVHAMLNTDEVQIGD